MGPGAIASSVLSAVLPAPPVPALPAKQKRPLNPLPHFFPPPYSLPFCAPVMDDDFSPKNSPVRLARVSAFRKLLTECQEELRLMRKLEEVNRELADFALLKIIKQKSSSKKGSLQSRLALTFPVTHSLRSKHSEDEEEEESVMLGGTWKVPW